MGLKKGYVKVGAQGDVVAIEVKTQTDYNKAGIYRVYFIEAYSNHIAVPTSELEEFANEEKAVYEQGASRKTLLYFSQNTSLLYINALTVIRETVQNMQYYADNSYFDSILLSAIYPTATSQAGTITVQNSLGNNIYFALDDGTGSRALASYTLNDTSFNTAYSDYYTFYVSKNSGLISANITPSTDRKSLYPTIFGILNFQKPNIGLLGAKLKDNFLLCNFVLPFLRYVFTQRNQNYLYLVSTTIVADGKYIDFGYYFVGHIDRSFLNSCNAREIAILNNKPAFQTETVQNTQTVKLTYVPFTSTPPKNDLFSLKTDSVLTSCNIFVNYDEDAREQAHLIKDSNGTIKGSIFLIQNQGNGKFYGYDFEVEGYTIVETDSNLGDICYYSKNTANISEGDTVSLTQGNIVITCVYKNTTTQQIEAKYTKIPAKNYKLTFQKYVFGGSTDINTGTLLLYNGFDNNYKVTFQSTGLILPVETQENFKSQNQLFCLTFPMLTLLKDLKLDMSSWMYGILGTPTTLPIQLDDQKFKIRWITKNGNIYFNYDDFVDPTKYVPTNLFQLTSNGQAITSYPKEIVSVFQYKYTLPPKDAEYKNIGNNPLIIVKGAVYFPASSRYPRFRSTHVGCYPWDDNA